jgi:hypothetical protein
MESTTNDFSKEHAGTVPTCQRGIARDAQPLAITWIKRPRMRIPDLSSPRNAQSERRSLFCIVKRYEARCASTFSIQEGVQTDHRVDLTRLRIALERGSSYETIEQTGWSMTMISRHLR